MDSTLVDKNYNEAADLGLRSAALGGEKKALETLITRHYAFVYNLALKMVLDPSDAEDIAQEIVIKIITNLKGFAGKSAFRTWLYRMVVNHILNMKKRHCEIAVDNFDAYGQALDSMPDNPFPRAYISDPEKQLILYETKLSCTAGMLMCLDREQRLILILGAVFEVDHVLGSDVLGVSKDNFRQKLSRAKTQLHTFMSNKCGLVDKSNPCRCQKKTKAFIDEGIVNPESLVYTSDYKKKINKILVSKNDEMEMEFEKQSMLLFRDSPFYEPSHLKNRLLIQPDHNGNAIFSRQNKLGICPVSAPVPYRDASIHLI